MATALDLVNETKRHLTSYQREPMNKLAVPLNTTTTSLSFTYQVDQLQAGTYIEIDLELMYVWTIDQATRVATVDRAVLGSVLGVHDAGATVRVNPRFPDFAIFKALNDDLLDLSSPANGLFAVRAVNVSSVGSRTAYDLAGVSDLIDILEVRYRSRGQQRDWPILPSWSLSRNVNAVEFPSGFTLNTHAGVPQGTTIRVVYKGGFIPFTNLASTTDQAGLPASAVDLPPMGAAVRLVAPREIKRNFSESQTDSRRATEVPPGAVSGSMRAVAALRANRIIDEANRLVAAWPARFPTTAPVALGY